MVAYILGGLALAGGFFALCLCAAAARGDRAALEFAGRENAHDVDDLGDELRVTAYGLYSIRRTTAANGKTIEERRLVA